MDSLKKLAASGDFNTILTGLDKFDFAAVLVDTPETSNLVAKANTTDHIGNKKATRSTSKTSEKEPSTVTNEMLFNLVVAGLKQQSEIKDSIIANMEKMLEKTNAELLTTKNKVSDCEEKINAQESKLEEAEAKINAQTKDIETLQDNLHYREKLDRKNKIIVSGPEITFEDKTSPNELLDIAINAIKIEYNHDIYPVTISDCRRFNGNNRILLTFVRNIDKDGLISAVVNKNKRNGVRVHINEFLSQKDSQIFYVIRKLRKKNPNQILSCYSRNGTVFAKMTGEVRALPIKSEVDIEKLKSKFLLSNFTE